MMPKSRLEIVEVVRGRNLHRPCPEFPVDEDRVGDDWNRAVGERQLHLLPNEGVVSRIVGVHGDAGIAQHRLRPGCGDRHVLLGIVR